MTPSTAEPYCATSARLLRYSFRVNANTVTLAIVPTSTIGVTVGVIVSAFAMSLIFTPETFVHASIRINKNSTSRTTSYQIRQMKEISLILKLNFLKFAITATVLAKITRTIDEHVQASAMTSSFAIFAIVLITVGQNGPTTTMTLSIFISTTYIKLSI